MKRSLLFFVISGLILLGCNDSRTGIVDPGSSNIAASSESMSIIKLPKSLSPRPLHKLIKATIDPKNGGVIHYSDSYNSANGIVNVDIQLRFQPGSVTEPIEVTVNINQNELSGTFNMDFGPSPVSFLKPALLTVNADGLNSSDLPADENAIKLVYDEGNNYIPSKVKKISINLKKGEIKIQEGELPHFSRYAFIT